MLTFVVRRLLLAVPVLLGVVFVVMLTIDLLPGDAVTLMLGEHATPDAVAALREHLGLDKPFLVRYVDYVGRVARGDLGRSIQQNRPVAAELADAWPATLELTVAALLLAAAAGIGAGVVSAVRPNSAFDGVARVASLFGATAYSTPVAYVLGHGQWHILNGLVSFNSLPHFGNSLSNGTG